MLYRSTRGGLQGLTAAEAIKMGLAPDGGLFVPEKTVVLSQEEIQAMIPMTYQERAVAVLRHFLTDYSEKELNECVHQAYHTPKFDHQDIAPLVSLNENVGILELFHGPTCAFKDMALQILPHFLVKAMKKTGEQDEIVILVATSGDTGKAALEGFCDVDGTRVIVFFPVDGVSEVQKRQMITQEGRNVSSISVNGNFDDAQTGVKLIFGDTSYADQLAQAGRKFSSANSINWGRLVPQIVYYFSAYADMVRDGKVKAGDKVNFVVPTGNFGNILAAWYAMEMGLPVGHLICAANDNNVLTDFIRTGVYDRRRDFKKTVSPSMDILISSNLERLLYEVTDGNCECVAKWMRELREEGVYSVDQETLRRIQRVFWSDCTSVPETMKTIRSVHQEYDYVLDTHTAVAVDVYDKYVISTGDMTPAVIVSTASPFKFNESVYEAIFGAEACVGKSEFELLDRLAEDCHLAIPHGLAGLDQKPVLHTMNCDRDGMKAAVSGILKL